MSDPTFLPYIRRGLGQAIASVDPLAGTVRRNPLIVTRVGITDSRGESITDSHQYQLLGPGEVTGIDTAQISRMEPAPDTEDAEPNYFAQLELTAPDLPWVLTPAAPTDDGALRPWLVLVVVAERQEVAFTPGIEGAADVLRVEASAIPEELWNLDDSWAWAHVQAACPVEDIPTRLDAGDGTVIARLMCPRRLRPANRYRAALVPAFDAGVRAGLGTAPEETETIGPAWTLDQSDACELPVYATWTFATADIPGDFEQLCERLEPDTSAAVLGHRSTRLRTDGFEPDGVDPDTLWFDYSGALVTPGTMGSTITKKQQAWLDAQLIPQLDQAASRRQIPAKAKASYNPERDDPVVGPPLHGAWAADTYAVPEVGWLRQLNLTPALRAAAGLGARVVRRHQHELLAAAWDQVGSLRRVRTELQRIRLNAEINRVHADRLASLDDATLLFTVGSSASFRPSPSTGQPSVRTAIRTSEIVPTASMSASFFRQARAASSIGRITASTVAAAATPAMPSASARSAGVFLAAEGPTVAGGVSQQISEFRLDTLPAGTYTGAVAADHVVGVSSTQSTAIESSSTAEARALADPGMLGSLRDARPGLATVNETIGADLRDGLDARASIGAGVTERVTGVELGTDQRVPTRVVVGPWFPDGLEPWLRRESPEFVMPGAGEYPMNRVRLLGVNEAAVAAFLVGANHEWAREALWREFPADLAATAFASFFDRPGDPVEPGTDTDLSSDIHTWNAKHRLHRFVGGAGSSTVILIRAQLVRRYPDLVVSLLEPVDGAPPLDRGQLIPERVTAAAYRGRFDPSTIFVGFDVDPDLVVEKGWYVSVEEHPSGPRFGLDVASGNPSGVPPSSWEELNWRHVNAADPGVHHLDFARLASWRGADRSGVVWAHNSAHQAAITFQRPYRMIFPAASLLGAAT